MDRLEEEEEEGPPDFVRIGHVATMAEEEPTETAERATADKGMNVGRRWTTRADAAEIREGDRESHLRASGDQFVNWMLSEAPWPNACLTDEEAFSPRRGDGRVPVMASPPRVSGLRLHAPPSGEVDDCRCSLRVSPRLAL